MKKHFSVLILLILLTSLPLKAQGIKSPYLFDKFQDATVFWKGNGKSTEKMNYDMVANEFVFVDKQTNLVQTIQNIEDIVSIQIGNRTFYQDKNGGMEIIPINDIVLYVQYKSKARAESPKGAYGGSTETSSVTSYSGAYLESNRAKFDPNKLIAGDRFNIYWLEKGNKKKPFRTFKQFLKLYPSHKVALENYIQENNIQFNDETQIKALCLYAESL